MSNRSIGSSHAEYNPLSKVLKIIAWTFGAIIAIIILLIAGVNIYLTPERLTDIINREGSKFLKADVRASNVSYTFWSTFPVLHISADSLEIVSKTLKELPPAIRQTLPEDCDFLVSTGKIKTGINVIKVIKGDFDIKEFEATSPKVNLVSYNDSINNFAIFPPLHFNKNIPHISIETVYIPAPADISYFNAMSQSSADISINRMKLAKGDASGSYHLSASAIAGGNIKNIHLPYASPVNIDGTFSLRFNPTSVSLSGFTVEFLDIKSTTDLDLTAGKTPLINSLSSKISVADVFLIKRMFPELLPENLKGTDGYLPLDIEINLTEPYHLKSNGGNLLSISNIPAFSTNVEIKGADISYPFIKRHPLNLSDINIQAFLNINPADSDANKLDIYRCSLRSEGSMLSASGSVKELLTDNPLIDTDIKCIADVSKLLHTFMPESTVKIDGNVNGVSRLSCRLTDITGSKITNLRIDGKFKTDSLRITDKTQKISSLLSGLALRIDAAVPSLTLNSPGKADLNLFSKAKRITTCKPGFRLESSDVAFKIDASMLHSLTTNPSNRIPLHTSTEDSLIASRTRHTPLYLVPAIPATLKSALGILNLNADITAGNGFITADAYPAVNSFSALHLSTDLDTLSILSLNLKSRSSSAKVSGKVKGLRRFLSSTAPAPLTIDLDAGFSDVNINELSGTYYAGVAKTTGKPVNYTVPPLGQYTASDSLCVVIPRNLFATVRLHSDRAEYKGWSFSPLSTELSVHNGIARIGKLKIGSDYCSAFLDWTYSTENLNNIFMHIDLAVDRFDFDRFFTAFPSLVDHTPELANISGQLSAKAEGEFLMFPDMFLNTPSLAGEVSLSGDSIQYIRDKKMARITHFMLLKGDGPLTLEDFTAHGSFHDNLLQVDPFTLKCGGYEIMLGGVNNLNGEIYYHLGLMHSPFHFPFGINLVGNYHHPEIRFGGNGIKDGRERSISADLQESANVNIMRQLKHGWFLFIENAGKYDAKNNHDYVFNVP